MSVMSYGVLFAMCALLSPLQLRGVTTENVTRRVLYVANNKHTCQTSRVRHDGCFSNFQEAISELVLEQYSWTISDVILTAGQHTLTTTNTVNCNGYKTVRIMSDKDSKGEAVINGTTRSDDYGFLLESRLRFISCVNVSLSDVTVEQSSPGTMFSFLTCRHVTVDRCMFVNTLGLTTSLFFRNTSPVRIVNSTFFFTTPSLYFDSRQLELVENSRSNRPVDFMMSHNVTSRLDIPTFYMDNCVYRPLVFMPASTYAYENLAHSHERPFEKGGLMKVDLIGEEVQYVTVIVSNSHFMQMIYNYGVPFVVNLRNQTAHNIITLINVTFTDNECVAGCAVLALFNNNPFNNTISLTNTNFTGNAAVIEGGAVFVLYENVVGTELLRNKLEFERCNFVNNSATQFFGAGSAVMMYSNKESTPDNFESDIPIQATATFVDCHFISNNAIYGTVFAKHSDVYYRGYCSFVNNKGGAIYAFGSKVTMQGKHNISHNTGTLNGGGLSLQFRSHATFTGVDDILFANNKASVSGGAIYADSLSSSQSYFDLLNVLSNIGNRKQCFLSLDSDTETDYEGTNPNGKIHFWNNTASLSGNAIYASTFQSCPTRLLPPKQLRHLSAGSVVVMAFISASCKCKKRVGDQLLPLSFPHGHCNRNEVAQTVLTVLNQSNPTTLAELESSLKCWNRTTSRIYDKAYTNDRFKIDITFLDRLLLVPFSNCLLHGQSSIVNLSTGEPFASINTNVCPGLLNATRITLTPAPGESFDLKFDSIDEFGIRTYVLTSLTLLGSSGFTSEDSTPPLALLHRGGTEYGFQTQLYFDPLQPVTDLSLVGPVGAKGNLRISWSSYLRDFVCSLLIPFELSNCSVGFSFPYANGHPDWTKKYIDKAKRVTRPIPKRSSRLKCKCIKSDGVRCDSDGRTVIVENSYWAGTVEREFVSHPCLGQCNMSGTDEEAGFGGHWKFNATQKNRHCLQSRTGVLCRQCDHGYSETPSGMVCQSCDSAWGIGLAMYIVFVALLGLLLVSVSMLTDLLGSHYFDSWIFYIQTVPLILRPSEEVTVLHTVTRYTVSLIHLNVPWCVLPDLSPLGRLVTVALPQLYLFFLVFLFFFASYTRPFSRYVKKMKVGETFFIALIVAYEPLAVFCTHTLSCSINLGDRSYLYVDPHLTCFSTEHFYYAIAALVTLFVVIPLPALLIYGARDSQSSKESRSKPNWIIRLSKACARSYDDGSYWWVGVTLWRRLVIAALAATVATDITTRQIVLFAVCLALFLFNAIVLPYRSDSANKYELLLLANLCLIGAFSINDLSAVSSTKRLGFSYILLAVLSWPDVSIVIIAIYSNRKWFSRLFSRFTGQNQFADDEETIMVERVRVGTKLTTMSFTSHVEESMETSTEDSWERPPNSSQLRDPLLVASTKDKQVSLGRSSLEH